VHQTSEESIKKTAQPAEDNSQAESQPQSADLFGAEGGENPVEIEIRSKPPIDDFCILDPLPALDIYNNSFIYNRLWPDSLRFAAIVRSLPLLSL
jgi:hypothetical protein